MAIETLRSLALHAGHTDLPVPKTRSMGNYPYDAASHGRRGYRWNPTRLGQNTLLYSYGLELLARSRDAVRNSPWARAAVDSFTANAVGRGIRLVPAHPDAQVRAQITETWNRWTRESDVEYEPKNPCSGQTDFYGQQMIIAREVMEAGEVFVRFRPRPKKEGLAVPIQLQLMESEQLPIWRNAIENIPPENYVRSGIEFRPDGRRAAYHFWKAHPGETLFFPMDALTVERVPAPDILHVYRPLHAGQFRGEPWLTAVLAKLHSLEKYADSELFRKEVSSMITGFIKQATPDSQILKADTTVNQPKDPSAAIAKLEPGTFPVLNVGEEIQFATVDGNGSFPEFMVSCLHAFAIGCGCTYEQVTGDLKGVSFSSIRAGLLEFRRKCEQFQYSVFIFQVCHPIYRRWMREAMLCLAFGVELMQEYNKDPRPFEDAHWVTPGWPWVDPEKDIAASEKAVRDGFSTRSWEVAATGRDAEALDAQQQADNQRADAKGLSYDSDGRKVLTGRNAGLTEGEIKEDADKGEAQV
jgi:lambda family phage portal protein